MLSLDWPLDMDFSKINMRYIVEDFILNLNDTHFYQSLDDLAVAIEDGKNCSCPLALVAVFHQLVVLVSHQLKVIYRLINIDYSKIFFF